MPDTSGGAQNVRTPSTRRRTGLARLGSSVLVALTVTAACPAALAAGASLQSATSAQKKTAGERFGAGMKAFDANHYDDALKAFRDSYNSVASPNSHLMIARTLSRMGRLGEAYEAYDKTEQEAAAAAKVDKKYEKAEKSATNERDALRPRIAMLTVQVSGAGSGATLTVAGRKIDQADWAHPVAVDPGSVTVSLQTADGKTTQKQVTATAGGTPTVQIAPAAPTAAPTTTTSSGGKAEASTSGIDKRTLAYIAGGVGAAGLVTFGVFGILDNSKYNSLKNDCPNNSCPASKKSAADTGRTFQTVANVGLVVGIVGLAGGATLYFLSTRDKNGKADTARTDRPGVDVGLGFDSVKVRGSF